MSTPSGATKSGEESARLAAVVVYLSGAQRGRSVRIEDATLYLAREDGRPLTPEEACESPDMATVRRTAAGYELVAPRRQVVWERRAGGRADSGIGRPDRVRQRAGAALPADCVRGI